MKDVKQAMSKVGFRHNKWKRLVRETIRAKLYRGRNKKTLFGNKNMINLTRLKVIGSTVACQGEP